MPKALEEYQNLIKVCPDYSWAYFNIGCILYEQGKTEQALEYFVKTTEINPKDIETYKILSDVALKNNNPEKALNYLETGLVQNIDNGDIHYCISKIYGKINKFETQLFHVKIAFENKDTLFI